MHAAEMNCREFVELVTEYLDGTPAAATREALDAHIAECGGCDAYLTQMRQAIRVISRLNDSGVEPDSLDRVLTLFRDRKAIRPSDGSPGSH